MLEVTLQVEVILVQVWQNTCYSHQSTLAGDASSFTGWQIEKGGSGCLYVSLRHMKGLLWRGGELTHNTHYRVSHRSGVRATFEQRAFL